MGKFKTLNPLLHAPLRLAIVSLLVSVEEADFNYLLKQTESTKGNLSVQLTKLKQAGYITITKGYKNNYPHTTCSILPKGIEAFENYVNDLKSYLSMG